MKTVRFVALATTAIPDPRINGAHRRKNGTHHRSIIVTQYLDSDGNAWERFADEPPTQLPAPKLKHEKSRRVKSKPKPPR